MAGAAAVLFAVLGVSYCTAVRTPGWYSPPTIAASERQGVRNTLVAVQQDFTERVRTAGEAFVFELRQEDVNRWLAMPQQIYPAVSQMLPPEFSNPFVLFEDSRITVAGRYASPAGRVVLSIDFETSFEDDEIVLRVGGVRCGSLPAPFGLAGLGLDGPVECEAGDVWKGSPPMSGDLAAGLHVGGQARWFNGGFDYRVLDVRVEPGVLRFKILPLGHRHDRG